MHLVQPLARRCVLRLARTRVQPHHVVLAHTLIGLAAAWLLSGDGSARLLAAALLLQVKTLLDNVDGGLARATGRVTELGRYLDTSMDLVVNVALFFALARHGDPTMAFAALLALTLVLSAEFNAMRRHLEEHGAEEPAAAPPGAPAWVLSLLRGGYRLVFAPQDRALRTLDARLFRIASGTRWGAAAGAERQRWADRFSAAALVNLGLSTQLLALGVCAAVGRPYDYVMLVLLQLPYFLALQLLRVARFRRGTPA